VRVFNPCDFTIPIRNVVLVYEHAYGPSTIEFGTGSLETPVPSVDLEKRKAADFNMYKKSEFFAKLLENSPAYYISVSSHDKEIARITGVEIQARLKPLFANTNAPA
jgi:hypothetical protein